MRYLIDTHILIWILTNPKKLSKNIIEAINSADEVLVSSISFWEISLKFSIGKLELENIQPDDLPGIAEKCGLSILEVGSDIMSSFHKLPKLLHKDPFDRLIIWTAISNKITIISHDSSFSEYEQYGLLFLNKN